MRIKVAKLGKNAETATDPNDYIFHSDYNTLKILAEGTHSPTLADTGGAQATTSVAHGKSFTPFVFGFCKFVDGLVGGPGNQARVVSFWFVDLTVDATNINFVYINQTGSNYSPVFKYYIMEIPL